MSIRSMLVPVMVWLNPLVIHQVMDQRLQFLDLGLKRELPDLATLASFQANHIRLHMMEQIVNLSHRSTNGFAVTLVFPVVDKLRCPEKFIGLTIRALESRIVSIIVMKIETQIVRQHFNPFSEFLNVY